MESDTVPPPPIPPTPIPLFDNANTYLDTPQSITAPEVQGIAYPLYIPEPNYGFFNPHLLETPSAIDPSTFDSSPFDPSVFDLSNFGDVTFDFGRQTEFEPPQSGLGLFWNPWEENANGLQDFGQWHLSNSLSVADIPCTATHSVGAPSAFVEPSALVEPSAPIEPTAGSDNIRHRLPTGQAYIRMVSKGRVIYRHPTAGQSYGKGRTRWEDERDKNTVLRKGNRWGMWRDKDEWETAKWMATTKTPQSSLNNLLKTERVSHL